MTHRLEILVIALVGLFTANLSAQKATITFSENVHSFGDINEVDGKASHTFEFTNTGNAPLVIQRVNASCGCTTPEWTQTPIEPGGKGKVTAIYNPVGRPGSFSKDVYVYSNASNEMERLVIKGNVIPKSNETSSSGTDFSVQMGSLGLNSKVAQLGNVTKGNTQSRTIAIRNNSNAPLKLALSGVPSYLEANVTPSTLQPNQEGVIAFNFDSKKVMEWGPINESVYVVLNGSKDLTDAYKLNVQANVVEDFAKMSAVEKRQAPIVEIKSSNLYFGKIKKGNKVRGKFAIKNVGTNPLEIRRIVNNNSDITIHPMRATIKGGKTENLQIDIHSAYLPAGNHKKTFTVQTNDPSNTFITYTVEFTVI